MTEGFRPRRTVLYMPSSNERALEKAKTLAVDALILDLEDAVAPDAKPQARLNAAAAVKSGEYGAKELTIRINGADTEWHADDLKAAAEAGPDAIVVPKVNSAQQVLDLVASFEAAGVPEHTKLWAMIESPQAILDAREILGASDRLTVAVLGTNDLVKELFVDHVPARTNLVTSLQLAVLAARATGTVILDGVYNDVKNEEGFLAEVEQGRQFGFDGKTIIHPGQIAPANEGFAPSEAAIENAKGLIEAFESSDGGVVTYNGKMVENLHVESAKRTLSIAAAIEALQA
ncbi:citrate lyase subunit beta [Nocardioides phosphati]|uniref:Citrate lyase subunit beta n=1 Tax=Nocardioides phosphati TaxID=1867775 RepID=A0ABQ2NCV9_9ACTN|nr:CoA ester lyase [Nocardioides phosphati]GGO91255.1 citrate lyase subunit beta [Nocardioides phosphati]